MTNESQEMMVATSPAEASLNYFNYFSEVEDTFIRRRGKHLHLCTLDWALIEMWKDRGIPLHIVLRGIERWFDFYEAKRKKRSVNMLMYCQEEVEAQYAEWLESRVGADNQPAEAIDDSAAPFSRVAILEHLERAQTTLARLAQARKQGGVDNLTEALERSTALLTDLRAEFAGAVEPDSQKLEISLSGLERLLSEAIRAVISPEHLQVLEAEIKEQLRPYRRHMDKAAYQQTFDNLLLKRLRDEFEVPRLSLFYL